MSLVKRVGVKGARLFKTFAFLLDGYNGIEIGRGLIFFLQAVQGVMILCAEGIF